MVQPTGEIPDGGPEADSSGFPHRGFSVVGRREGTHAGSIPARSGEDMGGGPAAAGPALRTEARLETFVPVE